MLRILIIEDELLTANDLALTLQKIDSEIQIVAIFSTVEESIHFLKSAPQIDVIFSDIQLLDGLSFKIFESVKVIVPIIFCTAFNQYALDAFNTNGIDYILKPFSNATVSKALEKFLLLKPKQPNESLSPDFQQLYKLLNQQVLPAKKSVLVRHTDKIIPVEISDIALFYVEDQYTFACTFDLKNHLITEKLEELENRCGHSFFRANRQYLVNRKAIKDASQYFNRKLLINLTVGYKEQIIVGKLKTTQFLVWLANS